MEPWFDRQPFGFSFGNRRVTDGRDAFGPPDPVEEERIGKCRKCGSWQTLNRDGRLPMHDGTDGCPCTGKRIPSEVDSA